MQNYKIEAIDNYSAVTRSCSEILLMITLLVGLIRLPNPATVTMIAAIALQQKW
jgi:hypothetical protein